LRFSRCGRRKEDAKSGWILERGVQRRGKSGRGQGSLDEDNALHETDEDEKHG
jgi:hypothetical protein